MRNHGWQPPFHPLQTVAIAVFCALAFSFYVFFAPFLGTKTLKFVIIGLFTPLVGAVFVLYIACTWIDPADAGVHRSQEKYNPKKEETGSGTDEESVEEVRRSIKTILEVPEEGHDAPEAAEKSALGQLVDKSCCKSHEDPDKKSPDEPGLYCSICDADISAHSKHCRACDKCVHGFDHHCRWLNNCVGTRNYKPFVALMVSCLLMLILEWIVGIVVLVRCFSDQTKFDQEIVNKLGSSFPRVAFIVVLMFLTVLALLATAPLTQLFCFHLILMHKGITTYDYILAVREDNQEFWEETGGLSSTTSPAASTDTAFSGYNSSSAGGRRIVFCTPPRMFVDQDQTIMALSDLEVGVGRAGGGKLIDSRSQQRPTAVGLNPFKLARVTTEDAARAAARARAKSSILLPNRPGTELQAANPDSDSSILSSSGSEIRLAGSRRLHRKRTIPGLSREMWSKSKQDRVSPLGDDSDALELNPDSSLEGLPPLPLEPRSPYRPSSRDAFSGDPRDSFPPPSPFSRFTGPVRPEGPAAPLPANTAEAMRISVNSDGYEASYGESGDDSSDAVGLSESWSQTSWNKLSQNPAAEGLKEENIKPWVATFNQDVKGSPAGQSVSSGSRVEANIVKANPVLRTARLQTSSPTVYEDSPLPSDFLSDDATTSAGETPGRGTSTYFYSGPLSEPQGGSSRRLTNVVFGPRSGLLRSTDDP